MACLPLALVLRSEGSGSGRRLRKGRDTYFYPQQNEYFCEWILAMWSDLMKMKVGRSFGSKDR
jgi:hypothetical protein